MATVVAMFRTQENENFSLFQYMNALHKEIENLNDNLFELNDKIRINIPIISSTYH